MNAGHAVITLCAVVVVAVLGAMQPEQKTVTASAYNSTRAQTDDNPNEGAWGDLIRPGMQIVAVSPDLLDAGLGRGTELQIESLPGTWIVLDRTASRHRNRIDIYNGRGCRSGHRMGSQEGHHPVVDATVVSV